MRGEGLKKKVFLLQYYVALQSSTVSTEFYFLVFNFSHRIFLSNTVVVLALRPWKIHKMWLRIEHVTNYSD